jgi:hypothetical protein
LDLPRRLWLRLRLRLLGKGQWQLRNRLQLRLGLLLLQRLWRNAGMRILQLLLRLVRLGLIGLGLLRQQLLQLLGSLWFEKGGEPQIMVGLMRLCIWWLLLLLLLLLLQRRRGHLLLLVVQVWAWVCARSWLHHVWRFLRRWQHARLELLRQRLLQLLPQRFFQLCLYKGNSRRWWSCRWGSA